MSDKFKLINELYKNLEKLFQKQQNRFQASLTLSDKQH